MKTVTPSLQAAALACLIVLGLPRAACAQQTAYSNDEMESFSAETPQGLFRCENSAATAHRQVLTLNGQILYQQAPQQDRPEETDLLQDGIIHEDIGCPRVLGNGNGFVVLARDLQPPQYGVEGYLAVNFNEAPPYLIDLGTSYRSPDATGDHEPRIQWLDGGLVLHYDGDLPADLDPDGAHTDTAPDTHTARTVLFSFATASVQDGNDCLPLQGMPLFGDLSALADMPDPQRLMPEGIRIGAPRDQVLAILNRYGHPYDPDATDTPDVAAADQLTLPVCGDATALGTYPLFVFGPERLEAIRLVSDAGQEDE